MRCSLWVLPLTVILLAAGCRPPTWVTPERLDRGLILYVEDSSDARDRGYARFQQALDGHDRGMAVDFLNWSPLVSQLPSQNLPTRDRVSQAADQLAAWVRNYVRTRPGRPVYLVGHGVGAAVVLEALDLPTTATVDRVVLLAPAVDPDRDLQPALAHVRDGMLVCRAGGDLVLGGIGPAVLGTQDGGHRKASAALRGFAVPDPPPPLYSRLHQMGSSGRNLGQGNLGGRVGATAPAFLAEEIRPFLLDGTLPAGTPQPPEE